MDATLPTDMILLPVRQLLREMTEQLLTLAERLYDLARDYAEINGVPGFEGGGYYTAHTRRDGLRSDAYRQVPTTGVRTFQEARERDCQGQPTS